MFIFTIFNENPQCYFRISMKICGKGNTNIPITQGFILFFCKIGHELRFTHTNACPRVPSPVVAPRHICPDGTNEDATAEQAFIKSLTNIPAIIVLRFSLGFLLGCRAKRSFKKGLSEARYSSAFLVVSLSNHQLGLLLWIFLRIKILNKILTKIRSSSSLL